MLEKSQPVSFQPSNSTGAINVKIDGSVLEEKLSFKMSGLSIFSKLDWGCHISPTNKYLGCCMSINLSYDLEWNGVVICGLMSWLLLGNVR